MEQLESYRQSLIATFDSCTQRALFSLQDERRTPSVMAARGTLFHRFVHHAVKKMWETGERIYPVDMAMEDLANHVLPQTDVPSDEVVPITMEQMKWLRVLVVVWCENARIDTRRTLAAEERYYAGLPLPSGETVQVTGQLDLLVADPPDGVTVIDYKSGFGKPPEPKNEERAENEGTGLTALGWAQWLIYSFLMFENFPNVQRVAFREVHVLRWKEAQAKMERWEMERLRDVLASQVSLLHRAIQEGPESGIWTPTAGTHCFGGETRFLTDQGVRTLRDACGQRVRVLNRHGEWEEGEVRAFGRQPLMRMTFDDGSTVRTTPDHRWWPAYPRHRSPEGKCIDCGTTAKKTRCRACFLRYRKSPEGRAEVSETMRNFYAQRDKRITTVEVDAVPLARFARFPALDPEGIRHGIVFGDGSVRPHRNYAFVLLQPHKAELARFFDPSPVAVEHLPGQWIEHPPIRSVRQRQNGREVKGCVRVSLQPVHYKRLPDPASCTPEYARGFIAGLIATDGSVGGTVEISCEGIDRGERIAELARLGGCITRRPSLDTRPSNFSPVGTITRELVGINILPASAPLVRSDHVARFENGRKKQWRMMYRHVVDLESVGEDEVFCLVVPGSESFTLANGVITSNCSMCANPRACPIKETAGIPANYEEAQELVREWHVAGVKREERTPLIKGWVDQYGDIEFRHARGRRVVGYQNPGSRALSVFEPREAPESPYDEVLAGAARDAGVLVE